MVRPVPRQAVILTALLATLAAAACASPTAPTRPLDLTRRLDVTCDTLLSRTCGIYINPGY